MARLILATAEGQQIIELRASNSLGRHPNNTIQLLDKIVSKEHCIVEQRDGGFVLRDLGSLNGTYINGERVRGEAPLRHGDEIALGSTRARYDDGVGPTVGAPAAVSPIGDPVTPLPGTVPFSASSPRPPFDSHVTNPVGRSEPPLTGRPVSSAAIPHSERSPVQAAPYYRRSPQPVVQPREQQPLTVRGAPRAHVAGTRVDVLDSARAIGTQIAAQTRAFAAFEQIAHDPQQLRADYERLRLTWELTRDIGLERELDPLLHKILLSLFKFVKADRGVILLRDENGTLQPRATHRRDGTETPIQVSSTILNHVMAERASVLTHDAPMDFASSKGKSMILNRISSAIVVPLLHEKEVLGALWLDSESLAQFQHKDLELVTTVGNQAAMFIENSLLAKKIEQEITTREHFSRLLSPNVAEQVISGKLEVKKGGVLVPDCTVFNSDIRGFTRMSEGAPADVINELLNEYFELMVETIFKYEGTLDKFMGDGIMAFWGAPMNRQDDPIRSVQCALDQMKVLGRFNRKRVDNGAPALAVGMGLHTGPLVAGYVGSSKAMSYTVIGDTVNTSSRLCGIALAGQIIVSESTLARLGSRFEVEELAPAQLKGKEKPLRIFNVTREKPSAIARVG
ncbi:MAG: FHA domain-containing protein [Polyangiaceae bacterium]|nr:FHA domain-containing protein [Polyangiaceae bacterium]